MNRTKLLVVDDHAVFRESISSLLRLCEDVEVVGEAVDGSEAVEKVTELRPDVVLMDLAMPVMDGLEAMRRILKCNPAAKIIVLSQYETREYILPLLDAGASGYVVKRAAAQELVSAIRSVQAGDSFLSPSVARVLIDDYLRQRRNVSRLSHIVSRQ